MVRAARAVVSRELGRPSFIPEEIYQFDKPSGAFVTINTFPARQLRGCIGRPYPIQPLWKAVLDSALDAAFNDPRFPPLTAEELDRVVFEVSVLTPPRLVSGPRPELPKKIKVGRHGIMLKAPFTAGLLLPQVAVEFGMDEEAFLDALCQKAGLPPRCWLNPMNEIYTFEAVIYEEESPGGPIKRKSL